jgi:hypothetical protein
MQGSVTGRTGSLDLTIHWPKRTRLIPLATDHVVVTIAWRSQQIASQTVTPPMDGSVATTTIFPNIVADAVTVTATAYPKSDPTLPQTPLATSPATQITVIPNASTPIDISMQSTIKHIALPTSPQIVKPGASIQVSAAAQDQSGALVLTTPANWSWSSDNTAVATVTPSGMTCTITGVANGTAHITALEQESQVSSSIPLVVNNAQIYYGDFSSVSGLQLNGSCAQASNVLRVAPLGYFQAGSAWITGKQPVSKGFDTTFQFQISGQDDQKADGLAFAIQNDNPTALGSSGEGIGYGQTYAPGITDSLVIEFDTFQNSTENDPNGNHISVQTRGTDQNSENHNYSLGVATAIPNLADGNAHTVRVLYTPGTLQVYLDDMRKPVLSVPYRFDSGGTYLSGGVAPGLSLESGTAWVGFTAATGNYQANHDILNWSFASAP